MKTNWIKTAGVVMLATIILSGINAQAPKGVRGYGQGGQGDGPGGQRYGYGGQHMFTGSGYFALDLTEEQQEQMTALRTTHYKTMTPLKNKMAELKAHERTLLSEEAVNMKAVNKAIDEQTELMNQMRKIQVAHKVEMKNLLNDEQRMKLEQRSNYSRHSRYNGNGMHRDGRGTGPDCRNMG